MPTYIDQMYGVCQNEYALYHHGIKGQKWGVRRFQNEDGTRTPAGKKREAIGTSGRVREKQQRIQRKIRKTGDKNIILRNTINDYRRGRLAQLETKAKHREAKETYKENKTAENKAALRKARGERIVKNGLLSVSTIPRGSYNRYRSNGESAAKSALKTLGKINPQIGVPAALLGAYKK